MVENSQIKKFLNVGMVDISIMLLQHYRELGLSDEELLVYIQIKAMLDRGFYEPSTEKIAHFMGTDARKVFSIIESMRAKKLVVFENKHDEQQRLVTTLDFQPLYDLLLKLPSDNATRAQDRVDQNPVTVFSDEPKRSEIFELIEREFGRQLSPTELETVINWFDVDHFLPVLIRAAIKEAVLNQALNLRYIESILVNWTKLNYRSEQDVIANSKRRKAYQIKKNQPTNQKTHIPLDVDLLDLNPEQL
ncbi:DnaD domain protein [Weissella diestrammenae]|uniref:DnaD domain protein n=1 Tax=Weissella diestrammenae TaxID=1162633 RepID=A0A7G9T4S3_9LACO|nr:DnaD domain protein [Weissella diestrammenae]MCM0582809.1 DnaD domain protein [Weissella diestrammenae]QNN75098.1 DnaD domain protein [Weissella diestrammenae]